MNRFFYRGIYFNSITDLIKAHEEYLFKLNILSDSLIFYEPPRIIYKYPLEVGKEWVFSSEYVFINKEVVGKESLRTTFGYFDCFKIKWKYDFDMNGTWDEDYLVVDEVLNKYVLPLLNNGDSLPKDSFLPLQ